MSSPAEKKGKGKVPARDYPHDKRLPAMGQSFEKHEGASSTSHRGAASLQSMYPEMDTYFSRFTAINERYTSLLSGKEDIHSKDKVTIMGTDYSKFSLKTRTILKDATANLPSDLQNHILKSKAINESRNLWYEHFKILVTTTFPNPDDSDDMDNILAQAEWEDYFGSSTRVYENKHPFPGLLINYNDETDEDERDPAWLSQMFESGFIRLIQLTSHDQISQMPQIIQNAVKAINSPFVSIRCWSTIPDWDTERWMEVHPSKHLVLINVYTYQGPWYEGDTYISYKYPKALAERWRNYFNNQIVDISHELWKDYHFIGSTDRILVFGRRPYISAIRNWEKLYPDCPKEFLTGKKPIRESLLHCGLCNNFVRDHGHKCTDGGPWGPYPDPDTD